MHETRKIPTHEVTYTRLRDMILYGVLAPGQPVTIGQPLPTYAIVNLGMPTEGAFVSTLVFGVVMSVGSPFIGKLADAVLTNEL